MLEKIRIKEEINMMKQIEKAVSVLKKGGVIAYPTDTVYGIGCSIFEREAVKRIFEIKKRSFKKPLAVAVSDFLMMKSIANVTKQEEYLFKKILPGPVTVLLSKKENVPGLVTAGGTFIGIRIPDQAIVLKIVKKAGFPIVTTSANISGKPPVSTFKELAEDLLQKVDFIVKGKCMYGIPSTVVNIKEKRIIREGAGIELVKEVLKDELVRSKSK